jgi:hypothetical protein
MTTHRNRRETVTDVRLTVVADAAANLIAQLSELNELRERVRKAQLLVRRSQRKRRRKKEDAFRKKRLPKSDDVGNPDTDSVRDNQKQVLTKPFCPRRAIVLTKSSGYFTSKIASKGQYVDRKNSWEQAAAKPN